MEKIEEFKTKLFNKKINIDFSLHKKETLISLNKYLCKKEKYHLYDYDIRKIIDLLLYDFSKYNIEIRLNEIKKLKKDSNSKKSFLIRYGEKEGLKRYNIRLNQQKNTSSREYLINKFGENAAQQILKTKSPNCLNTLIDKYGEEKAHIKYTEYLKKYKNGNSLEGYKETYGEDEGIKKYNERREKYNYVNTKKYYLEKYGKDDGLKKWNEKNKKIKYTRTKQYYIEKLGIKEGEYFYNNLRKSMSCSLENCIKRLGKEDGEQYYKNFLRKINNKFKGYSKISNEFIESLLSYFSFKEYYYGENEYMFLIKDALIKNPRVDLYIKDLNLIIEFFGDIWHANPKIFNDNDYPNPFSKQLNSKQIQELDELRINLIKEQYKCDILIIWEKDYKENKEKTINDTVNLIKMNYE